MFDPVGDGHSNGFGVDCGGEIVVVLMMLLLLLMFFVVFPISYNHPVLSEAGTLHLPSILIAHNQYSCFHGFQSVVAGVDNSVIYIERFIKPYRCQSAETFHYKRK